MSDSGWSLCLGRFVLLWQENLSEPRMDSSVRPVWPVAGFRAQGNEKENYFIDLIELK